MLSISRVSQFGLITDYYQLILSDPLVSPKKLEGSCKASTGHAMNVASWHVLLVDRIHELYHCTWPRAHLMRLSHLVTLALKLTPNR